MEVTRPLSLRESVLTSATAWELLKQARRVNDGTLRRMLEQGWQIPDPSFAPCLGPDAIHDHCSI
jgi:hypothetical protein